MKSIANKIHKGLATVYTYGEIKALTRILTTEVLAISQMAFYMKDNERSPWRNCRCSCRTIYHSGKHRPIERRGTRRSRSKPCIPIDAGTLRRVGETIQQF